MVVGHIWQVACEFGGNSSTGSNKTLKMAGGFGGYRGVPAVPYIRTKAVHQGGAGAVVHQGVHQGGAGAVAAGRGTGQGRGSKLVRGGRMVEVCV